MCYIKHKPSLSLQIPPKTNNYFMNIKKLNYLRWCGKGMKQSENLCEYKLLDDTW